MPSFIKSSIRSAAAYTLDMLYPSDCQNCGRERIGSSVLCQKCWESIPVWRGAKCQNCGAPSPEEIDLCGHCPQRNEANQAIARIRAAGHYSGVLRSALLMMKFGRKPQMAPYFADLMLRVEPPLYDWTQYEAAVYAPGHRIRRLERGFDQAALLAKRLCRLTGMRLQAGWARRVKRTRILAGVGGFEERRGELAGVFKARLPERAKGKRLLLVDDIVTTGATAGEIAKTLREAGAGPVDVVCAARAYQPVPLGDEEVELYERSGNWL